MNFRSCLSVAVLVLAIPTQYAHAQNPAQQAVNAFFQAVVSATVPFVNQLNQWKSQAQAAANKTVEDFTSCPSPAAQNLYDDLEAKKANAEVAKSAAEAIKDQAEDAHQTCRNNTTFDALCDTTYNTLSIHATLSAINATIASLEGALDTMAALKCPNGCSQHVVVTAPRVDVQPGGFARLRVPGQVSVDVCTEVDFGSFGYNVGAVANGNFSQAVSYEAPSCSETERLNFCTNYDVSVLLPRLQELRLVPPRIEPGNVSIELPTRRVRVVTGVQPTRCSQPVQVCTAVGGNVNVDFDTGQSLLEAMANLNCTQQTSIGCAQPPFALAPRTESLDIPDPSRARIRWTAPRMQPGEVVVDLTAGDFRVRCNADRDWRMRIPLPPRVNVSAQNHNLPYMCLEPNWVSLVQNP